LTPNRPPPHLEPSPGNRRRFSNRLEFYENWLSPKGMRDGRIGLAPLGAVLSFLYREEAPANDQIVERAGRYAADWTFQTTMPLRRWLIPRLPMVMRARAALGLGKHLILDTVRESRVKVQVSGFDCRDRHQSALFDQLRDPATIPMRAFYASAIDRLLAHCGVDAEVTVTNDQPGAWSLAITVRGPRPIEADIAA
jgi:hypothetical protein